MDSESLAMFEAAYKERAPLFGHTPTSCIRELSALLKPTSCILDLGSGDGRDSLYLLGLGHSVHAVDASENAVAALMRFADLGGCSDRLTVESLDVIQLDLEPESYDAIVGITILDHLVSEDHATVIDIVHQALRPGGFVAWEMHSDRDPSRAHESREVSEFARAIESVSTPNYLLSHYLGDYRVLMYSDRLEADNDHGPPHSHGFVSIIAQKEY